MNTEQLKAANPIEQVAARYTTLYRAGSNYKILCPFHDDHHPSLMLHVGKQFFKCHACGAGGDVIKLVMGLEKCSFTKAVSIMSSKTVTPPYPLPYPLTKRERILPTLNRPFLKITNSKTCFCPTPPATRNCHPPGSASRSGWHRLSCLMPSKRCETASSSQFTTRKGY